MKIKKNPIMSRLSSTIIIWFMLIIVAILILLVWSNITYAADNRGIEVSQSIKIPYCPSNNIEVVLEDYTYFSNITWALQETEGSVQTIFATCRYDCKKAGFFIDAKRVLLNFVFEAYVSVGYDDEVSSGMTDFEIVIVNNDDTLLILSLKNGLLEESDLTQFLLKICSKGLLPF